MKEATTTGGRIRYRLLALLAVITAVGCGAASSVVSPDLSGDFGTLNGASVEVTTQGGLAGLVIHQLVRHDEKSYVTTTRQICSPACGAALDSASGTLAAAADDSLFNAVWQQGPFALKDDYGHTPGSADMATYTLNVTYNGRTKTITADDGSMPQAMRAILDAMRGTIAASR